MQLFFNEVSLSTRLSPRLEFPNSRINHLVLRGIHNPSLHLLLVPIPKLTPQLAWLSWHFNSKSSTQVQLEQCNSIKLDYNSRLEMIFNWENSCKYVLFFLPLFNCFKDPSNRLSRARSMATSRWRQNWQLLIFCWFSAIELCFSVFELQLVMSNG